MSKQCPSCGGDCGNFEGEKRMTIERRMHVEYINPPIPIPNFDWEATFIGYDNGDPIGYGATRQEAIDNLLEKEKMNDKDAE